METPAPAFELMDFRPERPVSLRNRTCVYCGLFLSPSNKTREHVIGRRFVPDGKLQGQWNLILNACRPCNSRKADLEDDISAITLQPDSWGRYGHGDIAAIEDAQRKARDSRSRRTRKTVKDSSEQIKIQGTLGPGVKLSFQYSSPPQIDDDRAFELARLQLTAFFYMQTYNHETRQGGYWLHGYHPVMTANRSDWGNPLMVGFMRTIESWDCRLLAISADGFFKLITRKHPLTETWAWALEWNHSRRLMGFFGEPDPAQDIVNSLPRLEVKTVYQAPDESLSFRVETPLKEDEDALFLVFDGTVQPDT
ncbi:HNH endonuclease [Aminobacter anthyllidis]|uniref:HNH endonuclease n=1 Tax=Aminobacter anthyllidis TaxID=1035067 RepID=A0A9X1D903_9HYPH|nr:HNH endonuclease signature motif containing protein [Aminobacter anthyllidis]MBT1159498.1 HNH endonuclease [Aminobacter anthyllidis]